MKNKIALLLGRFVKNSEFSRLGHFAEMGYELLKRDGLDCGRTFAC